MKSIRKWVRTPADASAFLVATFFGSGLLPKAPGTWGTFFAIPFVMQWYSLSPSYKVVVAILVFALSMWATYRVQEVSQTPDLQWIVIDEALGLWVTSLVLPEVNLLWMILAAVLFRIFDIAKLPPVRQLDRASKKWRGWKGAWGTIADDLLAGVQAAIVLLGVIQIVQFLA